LFNELLNPDLSRNKDEATKAVLGHGVEFMWIVMLEAERLKDQQLFDTAASRMLNQLNVAWDYIYGGLINAVNVDHGDFDWPVIRPAGSQMEFHNVGEYNYMKSLWSVAEAMVGLMLAFEHTRPEWAARFYELCQRVIDEKFSLRKHGHPLHILYADRKITYVPRASRKGNYHYPRMLAYNIQSLDRMIARGGQPTGGVA
jgi:mannose/cellobiose epimerase-like protein (N-acyl-D-glucosamine 2-epimerase family)